MNIAVVCVGRLKESWWRDASAEYIKRLQRFDTLEILECADLPEPKNASPAQLKQLIEAEGEEILSKIRPRDYVVALAINGKRPDSEQLASMLSDWEGKSAGRLVFVIGGSNGLSDKVLARANEKISFSAMTFPHQLARVILLEQLYRARKILSHESYHK